MQDVDVEGLIVRIRGLAACDEANPSVKCELQLIEELLMWNMMAVV